MAVEAVLDALLEFRIGSVVTHNGVWWATSF